MATPRTDTVQLCHPTLANAGTTSAPVTVSWKVPVRPLRGLPANRRIQRFPLNQLGQEPTHGVHWRPRSGGHETTDLRARERAYTDSSAR